MRWLLQSHMLSSWDQQSYPEGQMCFNWEWPHQKKTLSISVALGGWVSLSVQDQDGVDWRTRHHVSVCMVQRRLIVALNSQMLRTDSWLLPHVNTLAPELKPSPLVSGVLLMCSGELSIFHFFSILIIKAIKATFIKFCPTWSTSDIIENSYSIWEIFMAGSG